MTRWRLEVTLIKHSSLDYTALNFVFYLTTVETIRVNM